MQGEKIEWEMQQPHPPPPPPIFPQGDADWNYLN